MTLRHFKNSAARWPGLFALLLILSCVSSETAANREYVNATPAYDFENYEFDATRPLADRVGPLPPHVIDYVRTLDERPDYQSYTPTAAELALIRRSLERLPPRLKRNLQNRGLGIYFIENFLTSAMTDWSVRRADGQIFSYMIFEARSLRQSMQALLNYRENTCFREDGSGIKTEINLGGAAARENAFTYLLFHEATHALDYSERISPYVESTVAEYQAPLPRDVRTGALLDRIWQEYRAPRAAFDFPLRDRVTFYGFRKGPLLDRAQAPELYAGLARSPFLSLYGTQMWPEDLAELVSMYYLTRGAGNSYSIRLTRNGRTLNQYKPLEFPEVRKRLEGLDALFR